MSVRIYFCSGTQMAHFNTWWCVGCRYNCISHSGWSWSSPHYHVKANIPQGTQVVRMWAFFGVSFVNPFVMTYGRWCQSMLTQSVSCLLNQSVNDSLLNIKKLNLAYLQRWTLIFAFPYPRSSSIVGTWNNLF